MRPIPKDVAPLPSGKATVTGAPVLRAMPWVLAAGCAAAFFVSRLPAHLYWFARMAESAREAAGLGACLVRPESLFYSHLLYLLNLPARLAGAPGDTLLIGQALGALGGGCAAGLLYARLSRAVDDWRAAALGAVLFAGSFCVWLHCAEAAPQGPALALGMAALALAWPGRGAAGPGRLAAASATLAAAGLLDTWAALWTIPVGAAAALGVLSNSNEAPARGPARQGRPAMARAALVALPPLAVLACALWLGWMHSGGGLGFLEWLSAALPVAPDAQGVRRIPALFKTFKFALLYRISWTSGIPIALAFAGLPAAWRRRRAETAVFGLWALCGAVRAPLADPTEIQVWTLAMPGIMGLLALSLDCGLAVRWMWPARNLAMIVGVLSAALLVGGNGGWLAQFEGLSGRPPAENAQWRAAARQLAGALAAPDDLALVPDRNLEFLLQFNHGLGNVFAPESLRMRAGGADPAQWTADRAKSALAAGKAVLVHEDYLDPRSALYARGVLPPTSAEALEAVLPAPGRVLEGPNPALRFRVFRLDEADRKPL